MPQVTIWLPEDVHRLVQQVRDLGVEVNLSAVAAHAIKEAALAASAAHLAHAEAQNAKLREEVEAWLNAPIDAPLEPDNHWDAAASTEAGVSTLPERAAPGRARQVYGPRHREVDAVG
jgi:hypothetical protein